MPRVNANTGRLFAPEDENLSLAQAVEDAILTRRGDRRYRPYYGSLVTEWGYPLELVTASIRDALRYVRGVDKVRIIPESGALKIIINDALILDFTPEPLIYRLVFGDNVLTVGGNQLVFGEI